MAQNPFDRRRINGPEESFPPVFETVQERSATWNARCGRKSTEIRPIFLQPGLISQANGSAYIETENTKLACAVYGPRQSKSTTYNDKGKLNIEVKFAPFSCTRRRSPFHDAEDRSLAVVIHQSIVSSVCLELFPKSIIDVFITIVENDGIEGCIASGSIAASTALADAGIEMFGLVASCSVAVLGDEIRLDPTEEETNAADGVVVVACMPALTSITNVWQSGRMTTEATLKNWRIISGGSAVDRGLRYCTIASDPKFAAHYRELCNADPLVELVLYTQDSWEGGMESPALFDL